MYPFRVAGSGDSPSALTRCLSSDLVESRWRDHARNVEALNEAVAPHAVLHSHSLDDLLADPSVIPPPDRHRVVHLLCAHYNHTVFRSCLRSHDATGQPLNGALAVAVEDAFGDRMALRTRVLQATREIAAGPLSDNGWVWLTSDEDGAVAVGTYPRTDAPARRGLRGLAGIDMWPYTRDDRYPTPESYTFAIWELVDWDAAGRRYGHLV